MSPREPINRSEHGRPDRVGWAVMAAAIAAYAALALYLSRGATFTFDDLTWLVDSDGFRPGAILTPHYGHLIADTRILYSAMLATVGPSELLIRLSVIVATSASSLLLYALLKRRLGPLAALAPAIVILLLGATPEPLLPSFMSFPQATAFGLGALLALERKGRYSDAIACLLLVLSAAALESGPRLLGGRRGDHPGRRQEAASLLGLPRSHAHVRRLVGVGEAVRPGHRDGGQRPPDPGLRR